MNLGVIEGMKEVRFQLQQELKLDARYIVLDPPKSFTPSTPTPTRHFRYVSRPLLQRGAVLSYKVPLTPTSTVQIPGRASSV